MVNPESIMKYRKRSKRYIKPETLSIHDAFEKMLDVYRLRGRYMETNLVASWEKITGKLIATHTTSLSIKNNVLMVFLDSAPLKQELKAHKNRLVQLVNEEMGVELINDIRFF